MGVNEKLNKTMEGTLVSVPLWGPFVAISSQSTPGYGWTLINSYDISKETIREELNKLREEGGN